MNDKGREMLELLAGYLDGELSDVDVGRVEEALAGSAELRRTLAEWRSSEDAMPVGEPVLPAADWEALAVRVEQSIAADDGERESQSAASAAEPASAIGWRRALGGLRPRPWAFGGGGALVAVLLVLLLWPQADEVHRETGLVAEEAVREAPAAIGKERMGAGPASGGIAFDFEALAAEVERTLAAGDGPGLRDVAETLDRVRIDHPAGPHEAELLALAVRAWAGQARMDRAPAEDACAEARARYAEWARLVDDARRNSPEGQALRALLVDACAP